MKVLIIFLSLVFMGCVTSGVKARAVKCEGQFNNRIIADLSETAPFARAWHVPIDLREARFTSDDLQRLVFLMRFTAPFAGAECCPIDLRMFDLEKIDLTILNEKMPYVKVTEEQAEYLKAQGIKGFVVVE